MYYQVRLWELGIETVNLILAYPEKVPEPWAVRRHSPSRYLKIGLRWLRGTIHKGRELLQLLPLPARDPERCFASRHAQRRKPLSRLAAVCRECGCADYYEQLLFSRIRSLHCST